jgi:anaerobic selenocysteine-containing dehydrogenase
MAHILVREKLYNREFVRRWLNWDEYLREERPDLPVTFDSFERAVDELFDRFTRSPRPRAAWPPRPSSRSRARSAAPAARYWICWSAWSSSVFGIVNLRLFALLRLMTSSNFVGSSIGNSPGLAPLRTLSTYRAARRNESVKLGA